MNNNFKAYFQNQIDEEVDFGPVMRFSIKRNDKSISHFIFVEGSTDEQKARDKDYQNDSVMLYKGIPYLVIIKYKTSILSTFNND